MVGCQTHSLLRNLASASNAIAASVRERSVPRRPAEGPGARPTSRQRLCASDFASKPPATVVSARRVSQLDSTIALRLD
jgi:hypothetical protein